MGTQYPEISFLAVSEDNLGESVSKSDIVITASTADSPFIKSIGPGVPQFVVMYAAADPLDTGKFQICRLNTARRGVDTAVGILRLLISLHRKLVLC